MHKVNSLVIIGSFFQYMMRTCPDYGEIKSRWFEQVILCTYFEPTAFEKIRAAGSFCLSARFIVRMAAARRMPLCA